MKIKIFLAVLVLTILVTTLLSCTFTDTHMDGINVTVNTEGVYALRMKLYSGDNLIDSPTVSYADNEMIKLGDVMHFDKPENIFTDTFTTHFSIITAAGKEITNEKMEIILPSSPTNFELILSKDTDGSPKIEIFID
ncbi:MAG: hypothetical protein E7671_02080 [Ruminococcaceae bacterium]|nr:hypothetical protein [Oscillospiraceae bacterium]